MIKVHYKNGSLNIVSKTGLDVQMDDEKKLEKILGLLESGSFEHFLLDPDDEKISLQKVSSFYTPISAAGGLIENNQGEFLFIFRREKWDLPKGKMDEGETALETAIREIEEETGVKGLELISTLTDSYHVYEAFGKKWLKTTHWFHFKTAFGGPLIPQTEEDINEIKWIDPTDLAIVRQNTYPAILEIISAVLPSNDTI